MKKLFLSVALSLLCFSQTVFAFTPQDVQNRVQEAQTAVEKLPSQEEEQIAVAIAVSLSMPKASLLRLAEDARDAGLPLTFRGVGTEINNRPDEKPQTILERYGKGLVARHMRDFEFLRETGATVQIDPVLFNRHAISDVPRVLLVPVCRTGCEKASLLFEARGDVTLRYALEHIQNEITRALNTDSENTQLIHAKDLVQRYLDRLGDRP